MIYTIQYIIQIQGYSRRKFFNLKLELSINYQQLCNKRMLNMLIFTVLNVLVYLSFFYQRNFIKNVLLFYPYGMSRNKIETEKYYSCYTKSIVLTVYIFKTIRKIKLKCI